jgi:hypothetical protein
VIAKLQVVEAHLRTTAQLIAIEADPISTLLVVMAAEEMILSLARQKGTPLRWDYKLFVKDEYHKEWRDAQRKACNYFKHADRDAGVDYSGPPMAKLTWLNEVQTLMNLDGYRALGGTWTSLHSKFCAWMIVKRPNLFHPDVLAPELINERDYLSQLPSSTHYKSLRLMLHQERDLPEIPPTF